MRDRVSRTTGRLAQSVGWPRDRRGERGRPQLERRAWRGVLLVRQRQQSVRLAAWRKAACPAWIPAVFAVVIAMLAAPRLLGVDV